MRPFPSAAALLHDALHCAVLCCTALLHCTAGKDACALEQLLLANALTCYRSQLLTLLRQDEDTASHLATAAAAAAAIWPDVDSTAAGPAAASGQAAGNGQTAGSQQVVSALQQLPRSQQLLLLLVAAWLLRLQIMLQLAGAADVAAAGQQQEGPVEVQLHTGDRCCLLSSTAAVTATQGVPAEDVPVTAHPAQQQEQEAVQQAQQNAQQEQQTQQAVQPPPTGSQQAKAPLRRGQPPTQPGRADSADDSEGGSRHRSQRSSKKRKRRSSKKHRRKLSSRHTSSGSDNSASDIDGDSSSGTGGGGGGRRRKKRQRRSSSSSSKDAASSDDEWAGLDLDGGGELLDAAAFQPKAQGTTQQSPECKPSRQQAGSAVVGGCGTSLARVSLAAQQQGGIGLPEIVDRLKGLAVGGLLWQWPLCVVELSAAAVSVAEGCSRARAGATGAPSSSAATRTHGQHVLVSGSISEVADAAAQVWLCCGLLQQVLGAQTPVHHAQR